MKIDIKITQDYKQIISLWKDVFGDDEKYIQFFLENCHGKECYGCFLGEELVSMLFLIDCEYENRQGKYVYAVATDKKFRRNGFMTKLLDYIAFLDYDFLCLVPAEEYLFDVYSKFGYKSILFSLEGSNCKIDIDKGMDFCTYFSKRNELLSNVSYVKISDEKYVFDENVFVGGSFFQTKNGIAAKRYSKICENLSDKIILSNKPVGMIYSKFDLNCGYFGLYLD